MSLCDTCEKPGACCSDFVLNFHVPLDGWRAAAQKLLEEHELAFFVPVRPWPVEQADGTTAVMFHCTRLGADGRCTRYDDRPGLCRSYEPKKDSLCWEKLRTFKDIPIRVI